MNRTHNLATKIHGVKHLHMNIHIIIYIHTEPQQPGGLLSLHLATSPRQFQTEMLGSLCPQ